LELEAFLNLSGPVSKSSTILNPLLKIVNFFRKAFQEWKIPQNYRIFSRSQPTKKEFRMKKTVLSLFVILATTTQAFAATNDAYQEKLNADVLAALVAQSAEIQLVDQDGKAFQKTLPELFAEALLQNYTSGKNVLSATSVQCQNVTPAGLVGASQYDCTANITSGDFKSSGKDLVGPVTESSYYFSFKASRVVYPGAKPKITTSKAVVEIAG
jgi:hypothetical protein